MRFRVTSTTVTIGELTRVYPRGVCRAFLTSSDSYGWFSCGMLFAGALCIAAGWDQAAVGCAVAMTAGLFIAACVSGEA